MKIGYFQCFAGISGDMILGSLVHAGLKFEDLKAELNKINISGFQLEKKTVVKNGITGTKIDVITEEEHAHRHLKDILGIIEKSELSATVKEKCSKIFTGLAEAEAKIHNTTKEKIHFHEVGSMDAIVDVVGSVCGLELLGIEKIYASPLHVGSGFTKCAHGTIPLPAPATLELLKNVPIYSQGINKELVTPTGAAIITTLAESFGEMPNISVQAVGYGAGTRDLQIPNLLRLTIGEKKTSHLSTKDSIRFGGRGEVQAGTAVMIEVNIDDMNPEFFDYLFSRLFKAGAQDVFLQRIQMKKNRPANILSILVHHDDLNKIVGIIFKETTTIGVRTYPVTKYMLPYEIKTISTGFGDIKVKIARLGDQITTIAPEYDECRKIAEEKGLPIKMVYDKVKFEAQKIFKH